MEKCRAGAGDKMSDMVLLPDEKGGTILGVVTQFGIIPINSFISFDELRRFAMGLLGYVEHFHPEIPDIYIEAFEDKESE